MGELVETAKALSAPATKLIEVVSRGIGRAYDPRYKKRMADASAYEIDTFAEAIRRNSDLPIFLDRDGIQLDARSIQELAERTKTRLFSQEMRKQQNIEAIVDKAYEELQKETEVSGEPVDDDWIVRFFNSVEDVSNEKLQEIWSRILAREIENPKSCSFRTLDLLKNLSAREAVMFESAAPSMLVCNESMLIPKTYDILENCYVSFDVIVTLSEAGLLNLASMSLQVKISNEPAVIFNHKIVGTLKRSSEDSPIEISIDSFRLTKAGEEIYRIMNIDLEKSRKCALSFFRLVKDKHRNIEVVANDVLEHTDSYLRRSAKDLLI